MDMLWRDIRHILRSLFTNPGSSLVTILTLALGIGATTAIFSVVKAVLLRPLPLHDPSRLVVMREYLADMPHGEGMVSPANFAEWAKETRIFASMGTIFDWELSLTGHGQAALVRAGLVNETLFSTIGARPLHGRILESGDVTRGPGGNTVLSHALWQRKFGGDPRVIGRSVRIDGNPYTIVGIMPREFFVPQSRAEIWVPYALPTREGPNRGRYLRVIARLAPGVTVEQAQAGMNVVARRLAIAFPSFNANAGVKVIAAHEQVVGNVRRALLIVFAAVGLLLLIGCVNVANVLLSRATARAKEIAIRSALGASRGRLIGQLLTESVALAAIAGAAGVFIAQWATTLLVRFTPSSAMMPRIEEIAVDGGVLALTTMLTLATGILFGLAPALFATRANLQSGLHATRGTTDRGGKRLRTVLVVAEVALATVLLIGAGLLIKTFANLEHVDPGLRPEGVLTLRVVLPNVSGNRARRDAMVREMLDRAAQVPGVKRAGAIVSINMPFTDSLSNTWFAIEGQPVPESGTEPSADIRIIAGDYFGAMGIPMLAGRMLDERAIDPQRTEFVVNDVFARTYFRGSSPIGRRLAIEWFDNLNGEIVGVVGSVRAAGLSNDPAPAIYFSQVHDPSARFTLALASAGNPSAVQGSVVRALRSFEPLMPISDVKPLTSLISGTIARPRFNATMLSLFAALGLLLATVGIYGVLSYSVAQRTREVGVRMALGADGSDVLRLVVWDGMIVAVTGIVAGLAAVWPAGHLLRSLLFEVEAFDPAVFAVVAATLATVALAASYIPARRATRVDPMIALRPE